MPFLWESETKKNTQKIKICKLQHYLHHHQRHHHHHRNKTLNNSIYAVSSKTSQELQMLSTVTLNCWVTKIVIN